jgi:hypothetical protein
MSKATPVDLPNAIPDEYLEALKYVMGEMNLDHACEMSQGRDGRFFLNSYSWIKGSKLVPMLIEEIEAGRVIEAAVIANSRYIGWDWFQPLFNGTICFTIQKNGNKKNGGICVSYFGTKRNKFIAKFSQLGTVLERASI